MRDRILFRHFISTNPFPSLASQASWLVFWPQIFLRVVSNLLIPFLIDIHYPANGKILGYMGPIFYSCITKPINSVEGQLMSSSEPAGDVNSRFKLGWNDPRTEFQNKNWWEMSVSIFQKLTLEKNTIKHFISSQDTRSFTVFANQRQATSCIIFFFPSSTQWQTYKTRHSKSSSKALIAH